MTDLFPNLTSLLTWTNPMQSQANQPQVFSPFDIARQRAAQMATNPFAYSMPMQDNASAIQSLATAGPGSTAAVDMSKPQDGYLGQTMKQDAKKGLIKRILGGG